MYSVTSGGTPTPPPNGDPNRIRPRTVVLDSGAFFSAEDYSVVEPNSDPTIKAVHAPTAASPTQGLDARYEVLQKGSTRIDDDSFNYGQDNVIQPPYNLHQLTNLNEVSVVRNTCVEAIATNVVGLGFRIKKLDPNAELEDTDDVANKVTRQLNKWAARDEMTFTELMYALKYDEETTGNAYLEVSRNGKNEIDGLYHVPAADVRVRKDRAGFIQEKNGEKVGFYKFGDKVEILDDGRIRLLPDRAKKTNEIIHFKRGISAINPYYGRPRDIAAIVTIAGDEMARNHNIKFFTHSATPELALIFEVDNAALGAQAGEGPIRASIPEGVKRKIMEHFRRNLSGSSFEPGIFTLPSGIKLRIEKLSQGQKDSGWVNYRKENKAEIAQAFRCPPVVIGDSSAGYATAAIEKAIFLEQVVSPEQERYSQRLMSLLWPEMVMIKDESTPLVIEEGGELNVPSKLPIRPKDSTGVDPEVWVLEFKRMSIADAAAIAATDQIYGNLQVKSINEIRMGLGLKPKKGGDESPQQTQTPSEQNELTFGNRPGGGRGPNGALTLPLPRRTDEENPNTPANMTTVGKPGYAMAKRGETVEPDLGNMDAEEIEELKSEMGEEDFKDLLETYFDKIDHGYNEALDAFTDDPDGNPSS